MTLKTIIDKGPQGDPGPEPALPAGVTSTPEHAAWKAAVKEREDWKKVDDGKPRPVTMDAVDADHAIAADPERYTATLKTAADLRAELRARMPIEARVAALEAAYDAWVAENEEDVEPDPVPPKVEPAPPLFGTIGPRPAPVAPDPGPDPAHHPV